VSAPTDEPPLVLPELLQQDIDVDTLRALFRDVSALGEALEVLVKTTHLQHASPERLTPERALDGLLRGEWRAVQLRYRHEGQEWLDTVMRLPHGYRVVRMAPLRP
jgi:hypothetical protein